MTNSHILLIVNGSGNILYRLTLTPKIHRTTGQSFEIQQGDVNLSDSNIDLDNMVTWYIRIPQMLCPVFVLVLMTYN